MTLQQKCVAVSNNYVPLYKMTVEIKQIMIIIIKKLINIIVVISAYIQGR